MQFIDLKSQYRDIEEDVRARMFAVLEHGQYIMGPEVGELEEVLASYVGVAHCVGMSSGTDALIAALMALEIGRGDEVITPPFTFIATGEAIALVGARPVFVDIDPVTYNIDPARIEEAITGRTRAIMPVSLYGQCAEMDAIEEIATRHHLHVIEDAAQSFGATYKGRRSCGLSVVGCTSFFPSKPLGAYGDAGACFTNDEAVATRLRELRNHGQDRRYHHPRLGLNARLDTLQAAVLLAKWPRFEEEVSQRARLGQRYSELFHAVGAQSTREAANSDDEPFILTPFVAPHATSVYAQYTIQVKEREQVIERLAADGIPTAVHYPIPLTHQPVFGAGFDRYPTPVSEKVAARVVSLPMHPYLSDQDQERIVEKVTAACG